MRRKVEAEQKENKKKALRSEEMRGLKACYAIGMRHSWAKKRQVGWGVYTTFKRVILYLIGDLYKYIVSRIISWIKKKDNRVFLHCLSQKY